MRIDGAGKAYLNKAYQNPISSPDKVQTVGLEQTPQGYVREGEQNNESSALEAEKTQRKNTDIGDIKVSLGNRDSSLVGLSNLGGIQSSVMRKAVSDMQKDSVLHEYQYFVGSGAVSSRNLIKSSDVVMNDEDGLVVRI